MTTKGSIAWRVAGLLALGTLALLLAGCVQQLPTREASQPGTAAAIPTTPATTLPPSVPPATVPVASEPLATVPAAARPPATMPAASPTPTPFAAVTSGATPGMEVGGDEGDQVETFVVAPSHQPAPADVLEEMALPGGGVGVGTQICSEYYGYPSVAYPLEDDRDYPVEWIREPIAVLTCGWQQGEEVLVTLARPDGESISWTMQAERLDPEFALDYDVRLVYTTTLDDPVGTYTATFAGESGTVTAQRQVVEPEGARLLFIPDSDSSMFGTWGPGEVWLYNFLPHERVRLFAYEDITEYPEPPEVGLVAWREYHTDARGQIVVRVEPPAGLEMQGYAAVGDISGEATSYFYAADEPLFDESVLDVNQVVVQTGEPLEMRTSFDLLAPTLRRVYPGTYLDVAGSARDSSGDRWWQVRIDGAEGWVAGRWVTPIVDGAAVGASDEQEQTPTEVFRITPVQQPPPEDVLEDVAFFGEGSWGDPLCSDDLLAPTLVWPPEEEQAQTQELGWGRVMAYTCGWQPDEWARVSLQFPDGRSISDYISTTQQLDSPWAGYMVGMAYDTRLDDPPGLYTLRFEGDEGDAVSYAQPIEAPMGPRLIWDWDEELQDRGQLLLYNFEPHERVRVFAYGPDQPESLYGHLVAWEEFQVGANGRLVLRPEADDALGIEGYAAVGDVSGEALGRRYWSSVDDYAAMFMNDASVLRLERLIPTETVSAAASEPTPIPEKLEFIAYDRVICGGVSPMPGCVYIVEEWISAEGTAAPGDPIKVLVMDPRSGEAPEVAACTAARVDRRAYRTSASPRRVRVRGEPCNLEPGYLFCVCDAEDFVRLEP